MNDISSKISEQMQLQQSANNLTHFLSYNSLQNETELNNADRVTTESSDNSKTINQKKTNLRKKIVLSDLRIFVMKPL